MNELKYLSSVYEQASEELKKQPAFLECLKNIDGMIAVSQTLGYVGGRYQVEVSDNAVKVDLFYSYFGDKPITMENNNRTGHEFEINLDENHNLCYQNNSGDFSPEKLINSEGNIEFGKHTSCSYDYSQIIFLNGTKEIIQKQKVVSPLLGNKNGLSKIGLPWMPLPDPNDRKDPEKVYGFYDSKLQQQIQYLQPNFKNSFIKLYRMHQQYWTAWTAQRDSQNKELASVKEFIQCPYGTIATKSYYKEPIIDTSYPEAMRIDEPYSITSYTIEQIEEIMKLRCEIYDNQEFQEAVQDMLYQRNSRGRK